MDEPVGIRKAQKLATRQKVLKAARELFAEIGYEDATIRVIADCAAAADCRRADPESSTRFGRPVAAA